jgi:hypothetical protein
MEENNNAPADLPIREVSNSEKDLGVKLRRVMLISRCFAIGGLVFLVSVITMPGLLYGSFGWAGLLYLSALALNITQASIANRYRAAIRMRGGELDSLAKRAKIGTTIAWVIVGLAPATPFIFFGILMTMHG